MAVENVILRSPLTDVVRRDFPYGTVAELSGTNANPLIDGEWLQFTSATSYTLDRGTGVAVTNRAGTTYTGVPLMVLSDRGRYDTQALGKVTVALLGMFEATTNVRDATGIGNGSALQVGDVANWAGTGLTKRGLLLDDNATDGRFLVGFVTKSVDGTGYTRFIRVSPYAPATL